MNGVAVFKRRKPDETSAPETAPSPEAAPLFSQPTPASATRPGDTGLGVPPFRPVPPKEAPSMSRPPFPAAPAPQPAAPAPRPAAPTGRPQPAERRTLVVGRGISVQGTVQDAERLVVEGTVEASMIHANELSVALGGVFKGEVEVEDAEVAGTIDGTLTARGNLVVRATGKVLGVARCRRLQVEDGGQITGRIEMITETRPAAEAPRPAEPTF
jgi:cytoskeletal protein CcmA (bactofilin family)